MTNTIKAERATVRFFDGLEVDGYRMPSGEFRIGLAGASVAAGYGKEWLGRTLARDGNRNKALQDLGFTGQIEILATETSRGDREAQTISIKDFTRLLRFADRQGKESAGTLLNALAEVSVADFFRDGFGEKQLTIEEKRAALYSACAKGTNWLEEEKEEKLDLALGMSQWH